MRAIGNVVFQGDPYPDARIHMERQPQQTARVALYLYKLTRP